MLFNEIAVKQQYLSNILLNICEQPNLGTVGPFKTMGITILLKWPPLFWEAFHKILKLGCRDLHHISHYVRLGIDVITQHCLDQCQLPLHPKVFGMG